MWRGFQQVCTLGKPVFQFTHKHPENLIELVLHTYHVLPHLKDHFCSGEIDLEISNEIRYDSYPLDLIRREDPFTVGLLLQWVHKIFSHK